MEYLAVHPDFQRQGIAGKLVREGLAVASQLDVKVIVLAKEAGMFVYEANGFRFLRSVTQERPEYGWTFPHVTWILIWEPE